MTSKDLHALMLACAEEPTEASVAALADCLLEASAEDRIQFARSYANACSERREAQRREKQTQQTLSHGLRLLDNNRRIFQVSGTYHEDYDRDGSRWLRKRLLHDAAIHAADAVEQEHWYAVRFDTTSRRDQWHNYDDGVTEITTRVELVPLDGGNVRQS